MRTHRTPGLLFATLLASLLALAACGDDTPVSPRITTQGDTGFDIDDNNTPSNNGVDAGGDSGGDVGADVPPGEDVGPDAPACACGAGEVCVTNDTVEGSCFPRDCPDLQCDSGEVCYQSQCVSLSCAGLDCGGYPNVCRAGTCAVGSCSDPDISCPEGQVCEDDTCYASCTTQAMCGALACLEGLCQPCSISADCGAGRVCADDQCVTSCAEAPDTCGATEVCNTATGACQLRCTLDASVCAADQRCDMESGSCVGRCDADADCSGGLRCDLDTGVCADRCMNDLDCVADRICDAASGSCVPEECMVQGQQDGCDSGEICVERRCVDPSPSFVGNGCAGCERMRSASYRAFITLGPVEMIGDAASSPNHRLQSGTLFILSDER